MTIAQLQLINMRNLQALDLEPAAQFNFFCGNNGAGKTSLLEAIYCLAYGRSFQATSLDKVIHYQADQASVRVSLHDAHQKKQQLSMQRHRQKETLFFLAKKQVQSVSEIAQCLPLQLISQQSYALWEDGPKTRRNYLDQGLFYLDPTYSQLWRDFSLAVRQKNAALKFPQRTEAFWAWNDQFVKLGEQVSQARHAYFNALRPYLKECCELLCPQLSLEFEYQQGWPEGLSLAESAEQARLREQQRATTLIGPQRADLSISFDDRPAKEVLSRGQKKLVIYALQLAKTKLMFSKTEKTAIYLIDEMCAELDTHHRLVVGEFLAKLNTQVFITGAVQEDFSTLWSTLPAKMFHVKHGVVSEQR